ncbi:MAG: VOC family protein [Ilumatobacteraceae bacterium]
MTNDGRPKRWVVSAPARLRRPGCCCTGRRRASGRCRRRPVRRCVGLFLHVDDFEAQHRRMVEHGVEFLEEPRHEPYGTVAVFVDIAGHHWDLLGPPT